MRMRAAIAERAAIGCHIRWRPARVCPSSCRQESAGIDEYRAGDSSATRRTHCVFAPSCRPLASGLAVFHHRSIRPSRIRRRRHLAVAARRIGSDIVADRHGTGRQRRDRRRLRNGLHALTLAIVHALPLGTVASGRQRPLRVRWLRAVVGARHATGTARRPRSRSAGFAEPEWVHLDKKRTLLWGCGLCYLAPGSVTPGPG
jgi:hypothetical protein